MIYPDCVLVGVSLAAVGLALASFVGWVVIDVIGSMAGSAAKDAVFWRPALARRRRHHRGLMRASYALLVVALIPALLSVAIATNGFDDTDTAWRFAAVAVVTAGLGLLLGGAWWRAAGRAADQDESRRQRS